MSMFDKSQPLWLPRGSVRAILVLSFAIPICLVTLKIVAYHEDIPEKVAALLTALLVGLIAIVKDYFTQRSIQEVESHKEEERDNDRP